MSGECKCEGCDRPSRKVGYCTTHYARSRNGIDMSIPIDRKGKFWSRVNKTDTCWIWTSYISKKGYGYTGKLLAHRVAYEWTVGPIPEGFLLDHMCHNRACVNPDHLRLVTNAQNSQNRAGAGARSASGVRGVYWNEKEQGWRPNGTINGWRPYLGTYKTLEEAEAVITAWRKEHMPYSINDQRKAV